MAIKILEDGRSEIFIRSMYVASKGKVLIQMDLSQAESWIVAFLANEPNMKHALMYGDIHTQTAGSALFNTQPEHHPECPHEWEKGSSRKCRNCGRVVEKTGRYVGKRYNHASAYRMGPERAAQVINKDSDKPPFITVTIKESKQYSEAWHEFYNLKEWWFNIEQKLSRDRTITTTYGRERQFFEQWGQELFKEATAHEPQSTVADHFNGAIHPVLNIRGGLIAIYEDLVEPYEETGEIKIVNQSHDSCIVECPYPIHKELIGEMYSRLYRPLIVNGEEFTIPVDSEVGERWGELEAA